MNTKIEGLYQIPGGDKKHRYIGYIHKRKTLIRGRHAEFSESKRVLIPLPMLCKLKRLPVRPVSTRDSKWKID